MSTHKFRELVDRFVTSPVDIASLAAFRFLFGLMMAAAMVRFLAKGWVTQFYVEPKYHFTYPGFGWIQPWPGWWMHAHFILLALLGLGVALGCCYRICIVLFFIGFTYVELLDQTAYLNHYYLISLLSGLMIFLPAHRAWSVDEWRKPEIRVDAIPAWCLNILRFQVAVVYIFAGLAKFNADWLFHAEPLRIWLAAKSDLPLVGSWLNEPWVAYAASWFGVLFDTTIVFFLLCNRTRRAAYVAVIFFHVATWLLFYIGMFPWIMIIAATLFFPAGWPRHWLQRFGAFVSILFNSVQFERRVNTAVILKNPPHVSAGRTNARVLIPLGIYAAVQLALPLRSYFYAEPPAWTCTGFNCAWRVMIAEKTGYVEFYSYDPATGRRHKLPVENYLTPRQEMMMAQDPDLICAFARRLAADLQIPGQPQIQIFADAFATLNGRPSQRMIDPKVNLAGPLPRGWILPLAD